MASGEKAGLGAGMEDCRFKIEEWRRRRRAGLEIADSGFRKRVKEGRLD